MKSIRHQIFTELHKLAEATLDELLTQCDQINRKQLQDNLNAACTEGLASRRRDDATGLPAYRLTQAGKDRLVGLNAGESFKGKRPGNVKPEAEKRKADPTKIGLTQPSAIAAEMIHGDPLNTSAERVKKSPENNDHNRGLYQKYKVERTDGSSAPGGKHESCEYFVLDMAHDKHAYAAVAAYAKSCDAEYPELANDLRERYVGAYGEPVTTTRADADVGTMIVLLADIREAIGDSEGRLMQDELVEAVREIAGRAALYDEATVKLGKLSGELVDAQTRYDDIDQKHRTLFGDFVALGVELGKLKSDNERLSKSNKPTEDSGASQYLILSPKRKPQRVKSQAKAQDIALSAASARGMAEVFALVPAGKAVRGAVWQEGK